MTTSRCRSGGKVFCEDFWGALPPSGVAASPQSFLGPKKLGALAVAAAYAVWAGVGSAQQIPMVSGLDVSLHEVLIEEAAGLARFRFLAPAISVDDSGVSFSEVVEDIQFLCDAVAIPTLAANGWTSGQIVISLSAQAVPFGEVAPDVAQFFQPFSIEGETCRWEDF